MGRYSAFDPVLGEWGEIVCRKQLIGDDGTYRYIVSLADRRIGEVWPLPWGWTAISYAQGALLLGLRGVDGFRSRRAAVEYLLNVGVRGPRKEFK